MLGTVKKLMRMLRNSELWGGLFWLLIGGFIVWAGHDMGLGRLQ